MMSLKRIAYFIYLPLVVIFLGLHNNTAGAAIDFHLELPSKIPPYSNSSLNHNASSLNSILAFDQDWKSGEQSPFVKKQNGFELPVRIGSAKRIFFPRVLNSNTPIIIDAQQGEVKQYLVSKGTYQAQLAGRYLVYRGKNNSILYRYDTDKKSLREFVFVEKYTDVPKNGQIIQWRFEGVELNLRDDGSVLLTKAQDIKNEVRQVSTNNMADRISSFW